MRPRNGDFFSASLSNPEHGWELQTDFRGKDFR